MRNPKKHYMPYLVFGRLIAPEIGVKKISTLTIKKIIGHAIDIDQKETLDIGYFEGVPHMKSTQKNRRAFIRLYKHWKKTAHERQTKKPDRYDSQSRNAELADRFLSEERVIYDYINIRL